MSDDTADKALRAWSKMLNLSYEMEASRWSPDTNRDAVVGAFDEHNAWPDYDTYLFKDVPTGGFALEIGCGPGRNIVKFASTFKRIDGADIARNNLVQAITWVSRHPGTPVPGLYHTNGYELNGVPSDTYDTVFATISLQHVPVHDARLGIFRDAFRALKAGGWLCFQMAYGGGEGVGYYENAYDFLGDVNIDNQDQILDTIQSVGFRNPSYDVTRSGPGDGRHPNWIWVRCQKPAASC